MPGPRVHLHLTTEWAIDEGFAASDAQAMADADIGVDDLWPGSHRPLRHFNPTASVVFVPLESRRAVRADRAGDRAGALIHLGRALHSAQDAIGHGRLGLNHLAWDVGLLRRQPDVWETMPASVRARIERASRRVLRRFLSRTRLGG
jgi:hypothetical protein